MNLTEILREIDAAKDESLSRRQRSEAQYDSRRRAYEKGIDEVRQVAGNDPARQLAEWIEVEIRTGERLPRGREVRKKGAEICRTHGHSISTGSWLGT